MATINADSPEALVAEIRQREEEALRRPDDPGRLRFGLELLDAGVCPRPGQYRTNALRCRFRTDRR